MENGKKNWIFCDGDLPPPGDGELIGHEALMVVNLNKEPANISLTFLFEDKDPKKGIKIKVDGERVRCFRLDMPIGDAGEEYQLTFGQYALHLSSDVPICAVFGRADVRQANLAYYSVQGYSY